MTCDTISIVVDCSIEACFPRAVIPSVQQVYQKAVRRHLTCGTTTCSYFASLHLEGTKVLVDVIRGLGQRAYVGKVREV